jgi:hypothetical protein
MKARVIDSMAFQAHLSLVDDTAHPASYNLSHAAELLFTSVSNIAQIADDSHVNVQGAI